MNISLRTYTRVVELIKQGKALSKFIPHETQLGQTMDEAISIMLNCSHITSCRCDDQGKEQNIIIMSAD
jgi:hypothetical protein